MKAKFRQRICATISLVAILTGQAQAAKKESRPAAAAATAVAAAKSSGLPVIPINGCVRQVPLSACKYVNVNQINYSAAVLSEVPFAPSGLPSAAPIPPNIDITGFGATLNSFSIKCLFAPVPGGVCGNIVIYWRPTGKPCPKI